MMLPASAQTATPTALVVDYTQTIIPSDLQPGDSKPLYIMIKNTGGLPAREVHVTVPSAGSISAEGPSGGISSAGDWFLGTINPGGSAQLVTSIRVSEGARIGTNYLTLYLTYDESRYDADGRLRTEEEKSKWILPIDVRSGSLFELGDYMISSEELKAGDNVELTLNLRNTGEADAYDLKAHLGMPSDGSAANTEVNSQLAQTFTVLGTSIKNIGDVKRSGMGVVEMLIHIDEDVESKAYTLPVTAEYEDKSGTEHTDVFYVGVFVSGERKVTITSFETDPSEIHSDDEDVEFTGKIENQGTEQVKNVKVTFMPDYPLMNARSYVQSKEVGALKGADSMSFTFYADVDENIVPQQTKVKFLMEYEVNSQVFKDEVEYTVDILDNPLFNVLTEAEPTPASGKGVAKVQINNVGSKCDGVTLIILEKRDQPFDFEDKSAYVGDLDIGEGGVASIGYTVEDNAASQPHIVPVEVRCTKGDEVLVFSKTMRLEVGETQGDGSSSGKMLLAAAIVLAAGMLAYLVGHGQGHSKACKESKKKGR
ncbi:MAG: hypothetical protein GF416_00165 [Candidatus Altiarchaeales archaeon]|nr:hypothetical protein [Candidatus Altiarchaeales archaeon]MBD3415535.1 hypothetical protein [Candidatus Altiarchaeales archaeon]